VLRGAVQSVRIGRKPALVIDEMDQAVTSHDWMSGDGRSARSVDQLGIRTAQDRAELARL